MGTRTEAGLRHNVRVGVQYLEAWLGGQGCVPLYHLMEDAATAEICRAQVWQWIRHGSTLDDGRTITETLFGNVLDEEMARLRDGRQPARLDAARATQARDLFVRLCTARTCENFLTLAAYEQLVRLAPRSEE